MDRTNLEGSFGGVALAMPLRQERRFCLPFGTTQGQETAGSRISAEEKDPACVQIGGDMRGRLAHFPPYGGNRAGRDGGAPVDYPRLPATAIFMSPTNTCRRHRRRSGRHRRSWSRRLCQRRDSFRNQLLSNDRERWEKRRSRYHLRLSSPNIP